MANPLAGTAAMWAVAPGESPFEAAAKAIEHQLNSEGWDQPARLFFIEIVPGVGFGAREFPLGEGGYLHPARMLNAFCESINTLDVGAAVRAFGGCVGVALACEGWMVSAHKDDRKARRRNDDDARARRIHERPDRVEMRQVFVAAFPDVEVMALRERGKAAVVLDGHGGEGTVVEALRELHATVVRRIGGGGS